MISNSQYLLAGNPKSKLLQIRDWFFFQVAFREYKCSCLQEQKFWFCVLLLYTVLAYLYLEWWWLHWNYCPFQHTVEFPFFFLFWDHLLICRLAMCYYHTFQNAIRKLSWSVYLQKLRGIFVTNLFWNFIYLVTPKPALSCIPTIFQVERLNNTFFNSSSRNLTFRVPTWVILLYQFLNRGTLQFAYICAVSFSVTNLNLRQQEKHLYS